MTADFTDKFSLPPAEATLSGLWENVKPHKIYNVYLPKMAPLKYDAMGGKGVMALLVSMSFPHTGVPFPLSTTLPPLMSYLSSMIFG